MVSLRIKPMFGSKILRERCYAREPWLDKLRLTKRTISNSNSVGQPAFCRIKVIRIHACNSLRKRENYTSQIKQISHRIVILKSIHTTKRLLVRRLRL